MSGLFKIFCSESEDFCLNNWIAFVDKYKNTSIWFFFITPYWLWSQDALCEVSQESSLSRISNVRWFSLVSGVLNTTSFPCLHACELSLQHCAIIVTVLMYVGVCVCVCVCACMYVNWESSALHYYCNGANVCRSVCVCVCVCACMYVNWESSALHYYCNGANVCRSVCVCVCVRLHVCELRVFSIALLL